MHKINVVHEKWCLAKPSFNEINMKTKMLDYLEKHTLMNQAQKDQKCNFL